MYKHPEQPTPELITELMDNSRRSNGHRNGTRICKPFHGKTRRTQRNRYPSFIDDIFITWTGSEMEFTTYMIKQIHNTKGFLDITLYKNDRFQKKKPRPYLNKKPMISQTKLLVFVTRFYDDAQRLRQTIKKHWKLIQQNSTLRKLFPEPPTIAYR